MFMATSFRWLLVGLFVSLWLGVGQAVAWVSFFQPFPEGEATVVVHRFCRTDQCHHFSQEEWHDAIYSSVGQWNDTGSAFLFLTRPLEPTDDPCTMPGGTAVVLLADPDRMCPGDGLLTRGARIQYPYQDGPNPGWGVRIYLNAERYGTVSDLRSITRLLLHEFGHAVGLSHPDEHGQDVPAVMNSRVYYDTLQPDDIAGIWALYGGGGGERTEGTLTGFLENPRHNSSQSGIGTISGWVCEAEEVIIEFEGVKQGAPYHQRWKAAYGTNRSDTRGVCGDSDNGFGLLFNWNLLTDGPHEVTVLVDGEELGRSDITVTTLDGEFLRREAQQQHVIDHFPYYGESVVLEWEQSLQNFVIVEKRPTWPLNSR